jgi:hypothetical protein
MGGALKSRIMPLRGSNRIRGQGFTGPAILFATLDPSNRSPIMALSEGNLRCQSTSGPLRGVAFATAGRAAGKWYWEAYSLQSESAQGVGIGQADADMDQYLGFGPTDWGYFPSGAYWTNNSIQGTALPYTLGDILGFALDMDNNTFTVYVNGVESFSVTAVAGLTYPGVCDAATGSTNDIRMNFGSDSSFGGRATAQGNTDGNRVGDFYYTPPAGYLAIRDSGTAELDYLFKAGEAGFYVDTPDASGFYSTEIDPVAVTGGDPVAFAVDSSEQPSAAPAAGLTRIREGNAWRWTPHNLLPTSNTLDNFSVVSSTTSTLTPDTVTSPDGGTNAWRYFSGGITGNAEVEMASNLGAISPDTYFTLSAHFRYAAGNGIMGLVWRGGPNNTDQVVVWFDIQNGTIAEVGDANGDTTYLDSTIEDVGGGWYRCTITAKTTTLTTQRSLAFCAADVGSLAREAIGEFSLYGAGWQRADFGGVADRLSGDRYTPTTGSPVYNPDGVEEVYDLAFLEQTVQVRRPTWSRVDKALIHDGTDDVLEASLTDRTTRMTFMAAVRVDSGATAGLVFGSGITDGNNVLYYQQGSATDPVQTVGDAWAIFIDGVEQAGATRGTLYDALSDGEIHILEARDLDLTQAAWASVFVGGAPTLAHTGMIGTPLLTTNTDAAALGRARAFYARTYGVPIEGLD